MEKLRVQTMFLHLFTHNSPQGDLSTNIHKGIFKFVTKHKDYIYITSKTINTK